MVEYLFVDVMALRSLVSIDLIGPLATLYTINAKGWPFILTTWGVLNFLLIQENSDTGHSFFSHWLYFLDVDMFNNNNDAGNVVDSELYREILVSMIIAGVATSKFMMVMGGCTCFYSVHKHGSLFFHQLLFGERRCKEDHTCSLFGEARLCTLQAEIRKGYGANDSHYRSR